MDDLDREAIPLIDLPARQNGVDSDVEAGNEENINLDGEMNVLTPLTYAAKIMRDLHKAATENGVDAVKRIIAKRAFAANLSCIRGGMTALHLACAHMDKEVVEILLKAGADPNAKDNKGLRPLHYVAQYFDKEIVGEALHENEVEKRRAHTRDIITVLCKYKAEVNATDDGDKQTPLHFAAMKGNSEVTAMLLEKGADCKILNAIGRSPFMRACLYGKVDVVQILFDHSDRSALDNLRNTPLHLAARIGHVGVIKIFFTQAREEAMKMFVSLNNEEKTPLVLAAEQGHNHVIRVIFQHMPPLEFWEDFERDLLRVAAGRWYIEVVKCLMERGNVDVATETSDGHLPLHDAAKRNHVKNLLYEEALLMAARSNALDDFKVLMEKCAPVDTIRFKGNNVLHIAAQYDAVQIIHFVVEHLGMPDEIEESRPANSNLNSERKQQTLNCLNDSGKTPLHVACYKGHLNSVRALRKYGAILNVRDNQKNNPLHLAAEEGHVDVVQQLLEWDEKLALATGDFGFIPLHNAALFGHPEVADLLSNNREALMARDHLKNNTSSQVACYKGHLSVLQILVQKETSENIYFQTSSNHLHIAASQGHDAIVKFLVSLPDVRIARIDNTGQNPLEIAIENQYQSVAQELLKHPDWKTLLVSPGRTPLLTSARDTPMRRLIKTFPEVAKDVFDKCITQESDPKPFCNYEFRYLDDTWMVISKDGKDLIHDEEPYDMRGSLCPGTRSYSENLDMIYDNHPLRLLVSSDCEYLLTHPLVRRLINHKWNTLGKYFYFSSLIMYGMFLFFFSAYVLTTSAPYNALDGNMTVIDIVNEDGACDRIEQRPSSVFVICGWGVFILAVIHLLKEFGQFWMRRLSYFTIENLVEIFIYISAILVVVDLDDCSKRTGIRQSWQWNLAAGFTFLQWMNLVMFVRKLPRFGIYVMMLVDIVKTFSRFFLIFALFVFAFSITFCIIFQNRPEFSTLYSSVLKTIVMMIGEFEFTGIFHGDADNHQEITYMNEIARPLFLVFAILMTILLMNMLTGLAVDDIKSIQEKSEIKRLAIQVDLVLKIESMLPFALLRRSAKGRVADYKNRSGWWRRLRERIGFDETIVEEINVPIRDPAVVETERRFAQQKTALDTLQSNVDLLNKNQLKMAENQEKIAAILDTILKAVQKDESEPT